MIDPKDRIIPPHSHGKKYGPPLSEGAMPIISLRLEGMRLELTSALLGQQHEISDIVEKELERTCTGENLKDIIESQVRSALKEKIAEEVQNFFKYGAGSKVVSETVETALRSAFEVLSKR